MFTFFKWLLFWPILLPCVAFGWMLDALFFPILGLLGSAPDPYHGTRRGHRQRRGYAGGMVASGIAGASIYAALDDDDFDDGDF